jgi:hypothetical protein
VAHKYKAARILAVDLSLSSLCYVKRKTPAGATKIEYAQAFCRNGGFDPAFNCFDGSGAGRIDGDGSVMGTIQFRGDGSARWRCRRGRSGLEVRQFARPSKAYRSSRASTSRRLITAASAARGWSLLIVTLRVLWLYASHEHCRCEPAVAFARAALSALITYPFHAPAPRDSAKASGGFAEAFAPESDAGLMNQESEYNPASGRAR